MLEGTHCAEKENCSGEPVVEGFSKSCQFHLELFQKVLGRQRDKGVLSNFHVKHMKKKKKKRWKAPNGDYFSVRHWLMV